MKNKTDFFKWLESVGKLDLYEAALDISSDPSYLRKRRLKASEFIEKLEEEYNKKL